MAAVTRPLMNYAGLVKVEVEYDDATVVETVDSFDADLIRFIVTNLHDRAVSLDITRSTGAAWRRVMVEPGTSVFPTGGPVRRFSDLSRWSLSVEF